MKTEVQTTPNLANKTTVVRGLLTELLRGDWQAADRLTEAHACERYHVSRTPVREAFFELQGLGLLEIRRNCGAVVLPFNTKHLRDIYSVRTLLEVEATRLATGQANREQMDAMVEAFESLRKSDEKDPGWRNDIELHRFIAESSGNPRLASEIARYGYLIQTIREIVGEHVQDIHTTSADQHLAILYGLQSGEPDKAANAMRTHLLQASDSATKAMESIFKSS